MSSIVFIRILGLCVLLTLSGVPLICLSTSPQLATFEALQSSNFRFRDIQHEQLDSLGGIWAIEQDHHGFIWFGGENGLARFDGYDLVLYRSSPDDPRSLSSNYVRDLLVDSDGRLWVATNFGLNLYQPEHDGFERFFHDPKDPFSISGDDIRCLELGTPGSMWIGTGGFGLNRLDLNAQIFERFRSDAHNNHSISSDVIYELEFDQSGNLWVGTESSGLDLLPSKSAYVNNKQFRHFNAVRGSAATSSISSNEIRSIYEDSGGDLWVGTAQGLNRLSKSSGLFTHFFHDPQNPNSVSMDFVQSIAEDSEGNLWLSTSGEGLNRYRPEMEDFERYRNHLNVDHGMHNNNIRRLFLGRDGNFWLGHFASGVSLLDVFATAFRNFTHSPYLDDTLNHNEVTSALEDADGNFWVATVRGINFFDRQSQTFERYVSEPGNDTSVSDSGVLGMMLDSRRRLWIGFWLEGLNILDLDTGKFQRFKKSDGGDHGLNADAVWAFLEDREGRIWVGTNLGGLQYYNESENRFESLLEVPRSEGGIECLSVFALFEDSKNNFWVGCANGVYLKEAGAKQFRHFYHRQGDPSSLSSNFIWAIQEDSQGQIWLGTQNGGVNLFHPQSETFTAYRTQQGLADNLVTGIVEYKTGELWFATGKGLSRYGVGSSSFKNYGKKYGMVGDVFNRRAFFKSSAGELVLGSKDGLSIFNPQRLPQNLPAPKVALTGAKVFNELISPHREGSPLSEAMPYAEQIFFQPGQSSFSLAFAALTFQLPEKNRYAYRLKGFDQDWNFVAGRREAFYTNLDPGSYLFEVKARNSEGRWSDSESIEVVVLPSWWQSRWAYALFTLILCLIVFSLFQAFWQRKLVENERRVSEQLRYLDKVKDQFLATTSHELRTPLNGMIGLSESLKEGAAGELPAQAKAHLDLIVASGRRLTNLVNDILDFSKLREHKILLKKRPLDLYLLSDAVLRTFEPLVAERPIRLVNAVDTDLPDVLADENRLQQILYNLVGNAVKFTEEGTITIGAELGVGVVTVSVTDTGMGIERENQDRIFCSYEQIENNECYGDLGTGLGLAVTKELVQLHGGEIVVDSSLGLGSSFVFTLALASVDDGQSETTASKKPVAQPSTVSYSSESADRIPLPYESRSAHIIVVDDEPVNRLVVEGILALKGYQVTECSSGHELFALLDQGVQADLVLLDVMMPGFSGFDTCRKLREQYSSDVLPVIFLSARNQGEDLRKAEDAGGSDFLTKPISRSELLKRVKRQLGAVHSSG